MEKICTENCKTRILCEVFDLYIGNEREKEMYPVIDKRETGINLRRIMDKRNISVKDVQKYLGLNCIQSVYHWLNGISLPTVDNLYALSALLEVPIDVIVCGNRKELLSKSVIEIENPRDRRLYEYYRRISQVFVA